MKSQLLVMLHPAASVAEMSADVLPHFRAFEGALLKLGYIDG